MPASSEKIHLPESALIDARDTLLDHAASVHKLYSDINETSVVLCRALLVPHRLVGVVKTEKAKDGFEYYVQGFSLIPEKPPVSYLRRLAKKRSKPNIILDRHIYNELELDDSTKSLDELRIKHALREKERVRPITIFRSSHIPTYNLVPSGRAFE